MTRLIQETRRRLSGSPSYDYTRGRWTVV
jgi:hypothetical protein